MKKQDQSPFYLGVYLEGPSPREGFSGLEFIQQEGDNPVPESPVRVFLVPHTHTDLCWPEIPDYCIDTCLACIDDVVRFQEQAPGFRFTMEHAFYLRRYLQEFPESTDKVVNLIKKGYFECGAFYFGPTELTAGGESLIRELYLGKRWLKEKFAIEANVVWNVDCPGHTQQLPQILRQAGIPYLVIWKEFNLFEHDYSGYTGPCLFRFSSPDGSEVVTCFTPGGYGIGRMVGFRAPFDTLQERLPGFLEDVAAHLHKYQLPKRILIADGTDVERPTLEVLKNIKLWNNKFKHPQITLATSSEFFHTIDPLMLPVSSGEAPNWWDTIGSFQNERVMIERRCEPRQAAAEAFSAVASLVDHKFEYPYTLLERIWENRLYASEHNSGGRNGILSDSIKLNKVKSARVLTDLVLNRSLAEIALRIQFQQGGLPIVIFNSLLWERKDIVKVQLTLGKGRMRDFLVKNHLGEEVPYQIESLTRHADSSIKECCLLLSAEVPALGYIVFYLVEGISNLPKDAVLTYSGGLSFENSWFRFETDPSSGCLVSLRRKNNTEEFLDCHAFSLGELIALENLAHDEDEHLTGKYWKSSQYQSTAKLTENGPLRATWIVEGEVKGGYRRQKYSFYRDLPRIDITIELDWNGENDLQVVQAFPFRVIPESKIHYGVPFGYATYKQENPDWTKIHPSIRGIRDWIHLSNGGQGITLASEVIPFDLQNRVSQVDQEMLIQSILLKTTYSCHDQLEFIRKETENSAGDQKTTSNLLAQRPETPEVRWHQTGTHQYRFAVSLDEDGFDPAGTTRFGMEHQTPLFSFVHYEVLDQFPHLIMEDIRHRLGNSDRPLPEILSFIDCEGTSVIPTWVKQAENGDGIIIRCFEASGRKSPVNFRSYQDIAEVWRTDILEYDQVKIPCKGKKFNTFLEPYRIDTFRMKFADTDHEESASRESL